jgi:hypothetical protein
MQLVCAQRQLSAKHRSRLVKAQLVYKQQCKSLQLHVGISIEVASGCISIGQSFGVAVVDDSIAPKCRSIASEQHAHAEGFMCALARN